MSHVSQIDLITAITRHLDRQGFKEVIPRQFNAIIAAADLVVAAFAEPHKPAVPGMGLDAWLKCDETGRSSELMARTLAPVAGLKAGVRAGDDERAHPLDPSDFGRCLGLLDAEPRLREALPALARLSPQWAALVGCWDELEALYREEFPSGKAPRLYARMRALCDAAGYEAPKEDRRS